MPVQTRGFVDVAARAREFGCRVPVGIALLPGNFSTAAHAGEFCYHAATPHVRSAWQSVGLNDEGPDPGRDMTGENGDRTAANSTSCSEGLSPFSRPQAGRPDRVPNGGIVSQAATSNESAKVPLVVFFGAGLLDGPAWRVTVAVGMVSSVLASHPRCASPRDVRLDIVVERLDNRGYACIEYQGGAFGIVALTRDVRRIWAGK